MIKSLTSRMLLRSSMPPALVRSIFINASHPTQICLKKRKSTRRRRRKIPSNSPMIKSLTSRMLSRSSMPPVKEAFRILDKDGKGEIHTDVIKEILMKLDDNLTDADLNEMIAEIDEDGSGWVDYDEFKGLMLG